MKNALFAIIVLSVLLLAACAQTSTPSVPAPVSPVVQQTTTEPAPTQQTSTQTTSTTPSPSTGTRAMQTVKVSISNFKFMPADVNVKVGDTVEWTNDDSVSHTVQTADGKIKSKELLPGDTFSFKFTEQGTYNYVCGIHPSMHGSVTVGQ